MEKPLKQTADPLERVKKIAAEFIGKGNPTGWFEELYKTAEGNPESIPWADLEPNKSFRAWAEENDLQGNGQRALVVGCGLGDDAKYLSDLGFRVTAFDISETAVEWARRLHGENQIDFVAADLFNTPPEWERAFEFVCEIHTIQPLPLELRKDAIKAVASFVSQNGKLVVVARGRDDDQPVIDPPFELSKKDLSLFKELGLTELSFSDFYDDEDPPIRRFVVEYMRKV